MASDSRKPMPSFERALLMVQTGAIDDVHRAVSQTTEPTKRDEGKRIIEDLAKLKYELQHDRKLTYVPKSLARPI
jgi:hypothetical protein